MVGHHKATVDVTCLCVARRMIIFLSLSVCLSVVPIMSVFCYFEKFTQGFSLVHWVPKGKSWGQGLSGHVQQWGPEGSGFESRRVTR